jgi:dTMP kinase
MVKISREIKSHPGFFVVIEGIDHTGKETQSKLLVSRLIRLGYETEYFDFPQYGKRSAVFVEDYLAGEFGDTEKIELEVASLFYSLDRFGAKQEIEEALENNKIIVSNRYTASNLAHQGAKLNIDKQKIQLWQSIENLEYDLMGLPRPDLTLILMLPFNLYLQLFRKPTQLKFVSSPGLTRDLVEENLSHQKKARQNYLLLAKLYPDKYKIVNCESKNKKSIATIEEISDKIWEIVFPLVSKK